MRIASAILMGMSMASGVTAQDSKAASQNMAPAMGIEVGEKAPAFSAPDQFGQTQTNETLKGSNGTVLLLFRSADW